MNIKKDKSLSLTAVWIGECVCGMLAFETSDGARFSYATKRKHHDWECTAMKQKRSRDEANPPD